MQANPVLRRASHITGSELGMLDPASPLEAKAPRPTIRLAHSPGDGILHVKLPAVKLKRDDDPHVGIVWLDMPAYPAICQNPAIHTMSVKSLGHLCLGLAQSCCVAHLECLPPLLERNGSNPFQHGIEPLLSHFQRAKATYSSAVPFESWP